MGRRYCCVPGCSNTTASITPDGQKVTLHRLPIGPTRNHILPLWIKHLRTVRPDILINDNTRVCSDHFAGRPITDCSIPTVFKRVTVNSTARKMKVRHTNRPFVSHGKENQENIMVIESLNDEMVVTESAADDVNDAVNDAMPEVDFHIIPDDKEELIHREPPQDVKPLYVEEVYPETLHKDIQEQFSGLGLNTDRIVYNKLQSLEMVGCEMLFIVASSDGEFQVYGSSKGRQYSIEHPCLITDFVRYCQGDKMEKVVEQTNPTTGDTEYITIDKLEKPPKPKLHKRKAKMKTPKDEAPTREVDVFENVTNASEGEESFDGSMDELDSEFEENETGPSRAPKRRKVFSNNDRLKSDGKRQAEATRSQKRRKVDAKSDGAKAGGKSETEVSRSPKQRKVDAKCVHAKSDGDESDSAPDDGSSKKNPPRSRKSKTSGEASEVPSLKSHMLKFHGKESGTNLLTKSKSIDSEASSKIDIKVHVEEENTVILETDRTGNLANDGTVILEIDRTGNLENDGKVILETDGTGNLETDGTVIIENDGSVNDRTVLIQDDGTVIIENDGSVSVEIDGTERVK